jgi:hypothetical protein
VDFFFLREKQKLAMVSCYFVFDNKEQFIYTFLLKTVHLKFTKKSPFLRIFAETIFFGLIYKFLQKMFASSIRIFDTISTFR